MAEPVTVRLCPLGYEHVLPMLVDAGCFVLLMAGEIPTGSAWCSPATNHRRDAS